MYFSAIIYALYNFDSHSQYSKYFSDVSWLERVREFIKWSYDEITKLIDASHQYQIISGLIQADRDQIAYCLRSVREGNYKFISNVPMWLNIEQPALKYDLRKGMLVSPEWNFWASYLDWTLKR